MKRKRWLSLAKQKVQERQIENLTKPEVDSCKGVRNPDKPYRLISELLKERKTAFESTHSARRSSDKGSL